MAFDGSKVNLGPIRFREKNLPDHLTRPPIDEETLMRLKAQSKTKPIDTKSSKKMSLGAQKEHRAEAKRVSDIQFKIKRAEKNLVQFFSEIKKIMDRADEENIVPDLPASI